VKRFGLTVLALGLVLAGCAQKKGNNQVDARLDRLEAGFSRFQEQQNARDADIDHKLTEIASRLDRLSSGLPPTPPGQKGKAPKAVQTSRSKRPIVLGQVVPYSSIAGNGQTPPPAAQPAPMPMQPQPGVQAGRPVAAAPAAQPVPAPAPAPAPPAFAVSPPVVTLGPTYTNVPPAAQASGRQPMPMTQAGRTKQHVAEPQPRPVQAERPPVPAQTPPPAPAMTPSMEPAAPAPLPPAIPQAPQAPQPPQASPAPQAQPSSASVSVNEQMLYTEALRAVSSNKNDEGRKKFNEFLAKYPNSTKTPEALYWIGESYMGDKSYNQAILSFKEVTARYPKDPKSDESLYRIADAYERLGDKANAVFNLKLLVDEHPNSEFAGKARQKLKQLGQ